MYEHIHRTGSVIRRLFVVLLSVALVCAFGLHDVQLEHVHHQGEAPHQEEAGGITEYLHAMDRKMALVVLSIFAFCLLLLTRTLERVRRLYQRKVRMFIRRVEELRNTPRLFDFATRLFCRGILNPRIYS